ncbi:MAG: choice-of-anchor D domain-containing protein [Sedimentisphaerales bacterium]|nr:choice-of-anchor D domain-containing protein [Sedimentisphaerales bacterium]
MGWRSASGEGVSSDVNHLEGESRMVLTCDGDPAIFWIQGAFNEYVDTPIPFHWEMDGNIYGCQYAGDVGWWDLSEGSKDNESIGTGRRLTAAAGPNGTIVLAWLAGNGADTDVYARKWDGREWGEMANSMSEGGISNDGVLNEKPSIAVNSAGEVFISYTAVHPQTQQREIVVKKYAPAGSVGEQWVELTNAGFFGEELTSGVSNDRSKSFDSAIAIDAYGLPVVAWCNVVDASNIEIFVKRWNGNIWTEYGQGSASDLDQNGTAGISNDVGISLQPDIAVAPNSDIAVTWINWADWENYEYNPTIPYATGGKAGVYVRYLNHKDLDDAATAQWQPYFSDDTVTNAGLGGIAANGEPDRGWFYTPQITFTSNSVPLIAWQGFGENERYTSDRDFSSIAEALSDTGSGATPNHPGNKNDEYPLMAIYASYFNTDTGHFELLFDPQNVWRNRSAMPAFSGSTRTSVSPAYTHGWMPDVLVDPNDCLLVSYTLMDTEENVHTADKDIYVGQWNSANQQWIPYGRSSNTFGNDVFGGAKNFYYYTQLGLVDYDNDPTNECDVFLANGAKVFLYQRLTGTWSEVTPANGYGMLFDLRGEPEIEHGVVGYPLLAYIDTNFTSSTAGMVFVYQWQNNNWVQLPGPATNGAVSTVLAVFAENAVSVQAGPNGQILLAYLTTNATTYLNEVAVHLWDNNTQSWSPVGSGILPARGGMAPAYYANFDGFEFNEANLELEEASWDTYPKSDDYGERSPKRYQYNRGQWFFVPIPDNGGGDTRLNDDIIGLVTGELTDTAGVNGQEEPKIEDEGLIITLNDVETTDALAETVGGLKLTGQMDYTFELVSEGNFILELSYEITPSSVADVSLWLMIDDKLIKINGTDPIGTTTDPNTTERGYDANPRFTFDTAEPNNLVDIAAAKLDQNDYSNGKFSAGLHTVGFRAEMTATAQAGADDAGVVKIDRVAVYQRIVDASTITPVAFGAGGGHSWNIVTTDLGNNTHVGPGGKNALYNFQENIKAHADGGGATQAFAVEDVTMHTDGEMLISFRYSYAADDLESNILVTVADPNTGATIYSKTVTLVEWAYKPPFPFMPTYIESGWWNGDSAKPSYTWTQILTNTLPSGNYDVIIEAISGTGSSTADLWLDDLSILTTMAINCEWPIATLLPSLDFAVAVNGVSYNPVYRNDEWDPYPDNPVEVWGTGFTIYSGYYHPAILKLNQATTTWTVYGDDLGSVNETSVDFLGFFNPANYRSNPSINKEDIKGNFIVSMPAGNDSYMLRDLAIGPDSVLWAATQHTISDLINVDDDVDTGGPNGEDTFVIHCSPTIKAPKGAKWSFSYSPQTVQIFSWDPHIEPLPLGKPRWVNANFDPIASKGHYTEAQIVGNNSQMPTVACTTRAATFSNGDAVVQRLKEDGSWEVLNTESPQNNQYWSGLEVEDLVIRDDGMPILSSFMTVVTAGLSDSVQEFRVTSDLPDLELSTRTIDFGLAQDTLLQETFTISNIDEPQELHEGDLIIYDMQFGGLGNLPVGAFSINNEPTYPVVLKPGKSWDFTVYFDPTVETVEPGLYSVVLMVHTNNHEDELHPTGHFHDIILTVEVISSADISLTPTTLNFGSTFIDNVSDPQNITITNIGTDPLTLSEWFFDSANFSINDGIVIRVNQDTGVSTAVVLTSLINGIGNGDDIVLAKNESVVLAVTFAPDELGLINGRFYVVSNDWDESLLSVILNGRGVSGAAITVEDSQADAQDSIIDFGSVCFCQQSSSYKVTITNTGTSALTIHNITIYPQSDIIMTPPAANLLGPGESTEITLVYAPLANQEHPYALQQLNAALQIFNDNPDENLNPYIVTLTGLGIPAVPVIELQEESPNAAGANDGVLVFDADRSTPIGMTVTQSFTLANLGDAVLTNLTFTYEARNPNTGVYVPVDVVAYNPFSTTPAIDSFLPLSRQDIPVEITVSFLPQQAGMYNYRLNIGYAQNGNAASESLLLRASASHLELTITDSQGANGDQKVDFGQFGVGQSQSHTVTLKNTGTSSFSVTNWSLGGDNPEMFDVTDFTAATELTPGQSLTTTITFHPTAVDQYKANLTFKTNILGSELHVVTLTGKGLSPANGIISDSQGDPDDRIIDFTQEAPIISGQSTKPESIMIFNNGGDDLIIRKITVTSKFFLIDISGVPKTLGPNEVAFIPVTFNPGNGMDNTNNPAKVIIVTNNQTGAGDETTQVLLYGRAMAATTIGGSNIRRTVQAQNGELVTFTLIGPGTGQIIPLPDGSLHIDKLVLSGTTTQTMLLVSASGNAVFGGIEGSGLGMLMARNITFNDEGLQLATLGRMITGLNLSNGADITIAQTATSGILIQLGQIGDGSDISVNGDVMMFSSQSFGNGTFYANNVGTFLPRNNFNGNVYLTGNLKMAMLSGSAAPGNFIVDGTLNILLAARATFTGAINAENIGMVSFGNIVGADISVTSRIQSVSSLQNLIDSRILAGYNLGSDGRLGGTGDADDLLTSGGRIERVNVQNKIEGSFIAAGIAPTGRDFSNPSAIAAVGIVGSVRVGSCSNSAMPCGVFAATSISSAMLGSQQVPISESIDDFEVQLLH